MSRGGAKSSSLDAARAARESLGRSTWATPRSRGAREGLRALIAARDSAKLARVAAINVLKALLVTAAVDLREDVRASAGTVADALPPVAARRWLMPPRGGRLGSPGAGGVSPAKSEAR